MISQKLTGKKRTYFTTIGKTSNNVASDNNEFSNQSISEFHQKRLEKAKLPFTAILRASPGLWMENIP